MKTKRKPLWGESSVTTVLREIELADTTQRSPSRYFAGRGLLPATRLVPDQAAVERLEPLAVPIADIQAELDRKVPSREMEAQIHLERLPGLRNLVDPKVPSK